MAEKKGFDLASVLKNVPDSGTTREQIEYIDIDRLRSDANNFYSLDGVDELAANIELIGLQQPIRVRPEGDGYIIVSGHRRCAALRLLVKDGRDDLREVPCIVEHGAESTAMQELRLIYANADTRKMSAADISRQAERVEMLLYQLKEEGVEFPGRMRDHVAEACKVSKSKLARLKVIEKNLLPAFLTAWNAGNLSETVAYEIAKRNTDYQTMLKIYRLPKGKSVTSLTSWDVTNFYENVDKLYTRGCALEEGHLCSFIDGAMKEYSKKPGYYCCCVETCCASCWHLASCENSCDKCAGQKTKKQAEQAEASAKADALQRQREEEREEHRKFAELEDRQFWLRLSAAVESSNASIDELELLVYGEEPDEEDAAYFESLIDGTAEEMPGGLEWVIDDDLDKLVPLADLLGCSTDYLLGRDGYDGRCEWQTGEPPARGLYYAKFDIGGTVIKQVAEYSDCTKKWYFPHGATIEAECTAWYKLPEDKEGE